MSYVKAVDIWMGGCLVFIFGAVFEYAYVSLVASNLEISELFQLYTSVRPRPVCSGSFFELCKNLASYQSVNF